MMFNPERRAMQNIDGEKRKDSIEKTAEELLPMYDSVHKYLNSVALDPRTLEDYGKDVIEQDISYAEKMRTKMFESDTSLRFGELNGEDVRKLAEILEYQVYTGINKHKWIPFCEAIKTSDFDDIVNGVDMVVEYNNNSSFGHLGLGIDVSFSKNLSKKFRRIKDDIDSYDGETNRLAEIKYFKSERSGISGRLFGMPRVVAALDLGVMKDLSRNMSPNHAARHSVIIEMQHQLEVFKDYAIRNKKGCVHQLERASAFMTVISDKLESEEKLEMSEYHKNDLIQKAVEDGLNIFRE